jgi:hypothetical protein
VGQPGPGIAGTLLDPRHPILADGSALSVTLVSATVGSTPFRCFGVTIVDAAAGKITCMLDVFPSGVGVTEQPYRIDVVALGVSSVANYNSLMITAASPALRGIERVSETRVRLTGDNIAFDAVTSPLFIARQSQYIINDEVCNEVAVIPAVLFESQAAVECTPTRPIGDAQAYALNVNVPAQMTLVFKSVTSAGAITSRVFGSDAQELAWQKVDNSTSTTSFPTSGGTVGISVGVIVLVIVAVGALVACVVTRRLTARNAAGFPTRTNPLFDRRTSNSTVNPVAALAAAQAHPPMPGSVNAGGPPTSGTTTIRAVVSP